MPIPVPAVQIYGDEGDIDSDRHNVCEELESERIFFVVQQGRHCPDPKHDDSADHIEGPCVLCTQKNIQHMEVMLGQATRPSPHCASISYGNIMAITFAGTGVSSETERRFFTHLVREGIHVKVESNRTY